ncbi:hypothetical protein BCR32DRAFT_298049 [Anaeromyces robustus]|uniref:Protein YOP1 n=1 Tax=Anaeromyces robustus TaxID=1754192 RepID=A0A1Y1VTC5_9FUNG|nr:hypothetical protein BCR32DRAFT_298049 [Anaeromyces robustus]|eukprot:ORX64551.1 hypothetical protein BCR32DRAFT_298049 [Anaeromyces robustus]
MIDLKRGKEKVQNKDFTPKELGTLAGTFILLLYLATYPFFGRLFADIIAFVYPAYKSFQALNYKTGGYDKRKELLIYWVTLAIFYVFEAISRTPEKVRLYYIYRSLITLWLYLPQTRGAEIIYNNVIRVVLKHNQESIDKTVKNIVNKNK